MCRGFSHRQLIYLTPKTPLSETNSQPGKLAPELHGLWPCLSSFISFSLHQIKSSLAPATCACTHAYHTLMRTHAHHSRTHTHHRQAHSHTPFPLQYLAQRKGSLLPGGQQSGTQWTLGGAPAAQDFTQCSSESSSRHIAITPCTHTLVHTCVRSGPYRSPAPALRSYL